MERGEQELQRERENEAENPADSDESETGSGLENRNFGFNTPPDSPNAIAMFIRDQSLQYEGNYYIFYYTFNVVFGQCVFIINLLHFFILYYIGIVAVSYAFFIHM